MVINRKPALDCDRGVRDRKGRIDGIDYIYTARPYCRAAGIFRNIWANLYGFIAEFFFIIGLRIKGRLDVAYIAYTKFPLLIYYRILTKLLGAKMVISIAELHIAVYESSWFKMLNHKLFDRYGFYFSDGVIAISRLLKNRVKEYYPDKPVFLLPILCDFNLFDENVNHHQPELKKWNRYLLYCGGAGYYELIDFILSMYDKLTVKSALCLVVDGRPEQMQAVKNRIEQSTKKDAVLLLSKLDYSELIAIYKSAFALLIPMRENDRDRARFPHKIGEYLAAKRPIVTNAVGEIPFYFKDGLNAVVCSGYNVEEYVEKIKKLFDEPGKADVIGMAGYRTGLEYFDYKKYDNSLSDFINSI